MQVVWIVALVFGIVIAIFAVQNSTTVPISFLWLNASGVAVSVLILISAALGALVTFLFGLGREVRLRIARRSTEKAARSTEQRLQELEGEVKRLEAEKLRLERELAVARRALAGHGDADQSADQVSHRGGAAADQQHARPTVEETPARQE